LLVVGNARKCCRSRKGEEPELQRPEIEDILRHRERESIEESGRKCSRGECFMNPSMAPNGKNGIVNVPSRHSVDGTTETLQGILQARGVRLFALIDHSGEAEKVGLTMRPTKLLIFGSPKAGTPLMIAAPSVAIDLPLKILVWEDEQGKVWISYNSPAYLQERHGFGAELLPNISVVEGLAAKAAE
jgi:uncharacterized protein (DUF302 family)